MDTWFECRIRKALGRHELRELSLISELPLGFFRLEKTFKKEIHGFEN